MTAHLGNSLTVNNKKVVLLELDLRKPKLSRFLGQDNQVGVTNFSVENKTIDEIIKPIPDADGLFHISSGPIPPNPVPTVPTRPIAQATTPVRASFGTEITTLAYLDWSGLRPMTEFEYEKAARGPVAPVAGEFAWGTTDVALLSYQAATPGTGSLSNDGLPNEGPAANYNEAGGNAWVRPTMLTLPGGGPILGPARVGMFAKPTYNPPTPPRIQSGAGYYGVMDLTGNVWELVAKWSFPTTASAAALFVADHGDGALNSASGQANVAGWTSAATFFGVRGGSFADQPIPLSQRTVISATTNPGLRGVRTAPVTGP
jgi:hypothetical protein